MTIVINKEKPSDLLTDLERAKVILAVNDNVDATESFKIEEVLNKEGRFTLIKVSNI